MALTAKGRAFAQAVLDGMTNRDAAIHAGYSEKSASTKGAMLAKDPEIIEYINKLNNKSASAQNSPKSASKSASKSATPLKPVQVERIEPEVEQPKSQFVGRDEIAIGSKDDPLEYLKSVWTDECEDQELRLAAARAALPYVHGKVSEKGKKETRADEARNIAQGASKFATRAARKTYS